MLYCILNAVQFFVKLMSTVCAHMDAGVCVRARARTHVCVYKRTLAQINTNNFARLF